MDQPISIKEIMAYFNNDLPADDPRRKPTRFASEWKELTSEDKYQLGFGIAIKSMTY